MVKTGDSVDIGNGKKLVFVEMRMLHWPDSMATFMTGDNILFSNDAFGEHLATSQRFDDEVDLATLMYECQKYYANILMLYGRQAQTALKALSGLEINLIATGHGVIWRKHIKDIMACYEKWSAGEVEERAVMEAALQAGARRVLLLFVLTELCLQVLIRLIVRKSQTHCRSSLSSVVKIIQI